MTSFVEIPGSHPEIRDEIRRSQLDPLNQRDEFLAAFDNNASSLDGHCCATAWVFTPDGDRVLLVEHPQLGWACPGGHLDLGETSLQAAKRELREETALNLTPRDTSPLLLHRARSGKPSCGWHWNVGWAFVGDPREMIIPEPGRPVCWFDISNLPDATAPDLQQLLQFVAVDRL